MYSESEKERIYIERTKRDYPWVWSSYLEMIACEKMSVDELHDYSWRHRLAVLNYAYENCPFYRELYTKNGVHPSAIKTEDDWSRLPIITKAMVREHSDRILSTNLEGRIVRRTATGGSRGTPLSLAFDLKARGPAQHWRFRGWWLGRKPGELTGPGPIIGLNEAWVRRIVGLGSVTVEEQARRAQQIFPMRHLYLDSQNLCTATVQAFDRDASEDGIAYLYGYPEAVTELARIYARGEVKKGPYWPKVAYTAGANLAKPARDLIKSVFNCEVYDAYGSNELARIAAECAVHDGNMHVYADRLHLELVGDNGLSVPVGEVGETVVTTLHEYVMPLIRYNQGDRTRFVPGKCACGLSLPRIAPIDGRVFDYLINREFAHISVAGVCSVFDDCPQCVRQFRFVQERPGEVDCLVVPSDHTDATLTAINTTLMNYFAAQQDRLSLQLHFVDSLPYISDKGRIIYRKINDL